MIPLSLKTLDRVRRVFSKEHVNKVCARLERDCGDRIPLWPTKTPEGLERLRFSVLKMSGGSLEALDRALALAQQDWRDALMNAGFGRDPQKHLSWTGEEE